MVGRGGRSKACLDCRKRRLKCDLGKPRCLRCIRDGFSCDGYPNTVFIDERPKLNNDRDRALVVAASSSSSSSSPSSSSQTLQLQSCLTIAFSEDLALRYLRSTVFPGADHEDTAPWPGFNAIHMPDSLAYRCLLLLALTYFGRAQVSNDILHAGSKMYVGSLTTLNENLRHPRKSRSNDTLLSIIILGIYEMLVLSSQDGWINHTLGLAAVIEMRGPALHQQGSPALQAFEASRFLIILASLAVSKATFLSQPQWKSTPWSADPSAKCDMQHLLDIVADLPGLKEQLQQQQQQQQRQHQSSGDCLDMLPKLRSATLDTIDSLLAWRQTWENEAANRAVEFRNIDPASSHLFPTMLSFSSLHAANCVCIFDASLIQAVEILVGSVSPLPIRAREEPDSNITTTTTTTDFFAPQEQLAHEAAIEICRSIDYQLSSSNPMIAQLIVLFPMRMAWKALKGHSTPEGRWIEDKLRQLSSSKQNWQVLQQTITFKAGPTTAA